MRDRVVSRVLALSVFLSAGGLQEPIRATLAEIHRHPSRFHEREVLVRGELDLGRTPFDEMYVLPGAGGQPLRVAPQAPRSNQSRRSALHQGADLRELVVLTFVTRGY